MKVEGSYYSAGLEVIDEMTNEELLVLRDIYLKKGGTISSTIELYDEYKACPDQPIKYRPLMRKEFLEYGSNTFWSNNTYKEILIKVCKKMKVNFNEKKDIEHIEDNLLEKVLEDAWENMTESERDEVLRSCGKSEYSKGAGATVLIAAFRAGGFASYQLAVIIANVIAKFVLGRGLSLAANAALTRALSIFTGPIGIALTAIWTIVDIAGPAYRVIIPAVIYVAACRKAHKSEYYKNISF